MGDVFSDVDLCLGRFLAESVRLVILGYGGYVLGGNTLASGQIWADLR